MSDWIEQLFWAGVSVVFGAIGWLIRTVLTSQKKIELLESEIKNRDSRRDEDRQFWLDMRADFKSEINEVKEDLHDVKSELLELWKQK